MKSIRLLAGVIVAAANLLCAQEVTLPAAIVSPLPPVPSYTAVTQYLGLSDAQLQALQEVQRSRAAADQAIYKQISDKQSKLNNLLNSGSNDILQIGQLTLDISSLRKQLPIAGAPFRESALAVLAQDQKNRLVGLTNALQLQPAASQAITLNLIEPVNPSRPIIYFTPAPVPLETTPGAIEP
jgi:hypothetical protein